MEKEPIKSKYDFTGVYRAILDKGQNDSCIVAIDYLLHGNIFARVHKEHDPKKETGLVCVNRLTKLDNAVRFRFEVSADWWAAIDLLNDNGFAGFKVCGIPSWIEFDCPNPYNNAY